MVCHWMLLENCSDTRNFPPLSATYTIHCLKKILTNWLVKRCNRSVVNLVVSGYNWVQNCRHTNFARTGAERRLRTHACLHGFVSTRAHKKIRVGFPTNSHFFLERETGLEPAASTLARSRSTNWATRAFLIFCCSREHKRYNTPWFSFCQHLFLFFLQRNKKS